MTEEMEIHDESPVSHFSQIPNMVDDMGLTPYAYRLYGHLKRVTGEKGKCWQSTETLAKACGMSAGKISESKKELENVWPPLIRVVSKKKDDGQIYHEIVMTDIWKVNNQFYVGVKDEQVHIVKGLARSPGETYPSRGESKNNPIVQEEPTTGAIAPENMPLDWKMGHNIDITANDLDQLKLDTQKARTIADLIDMQCPGGGALAFEFMATRGIVFPPSKVKGQRKAARELLEQGVRPEHVGEAVYMLLAKNMTVVDLFSITKTAVSLAHPPVEQGYNPQELAVT